MILQDAKQFGLQFEGDFADLIEEESSFISQFKAADFLGDSAGKCALLVSK